MWYYFKTSDLYKKQVVRVDVDMFMGPEGTYPKDLELDEEVESKKTSDLIKENLKTNAFSLLGKKRILKY